MSESRFVDQLLAGLDLPPWVERFATGDRSHATSADALLCALEADGAVRRLLTPSGPTLAIYEPVTGLWSIGAAAKSRARTVLLEMADALDAAALALADTAEVWADSADRIDRQMTDAATAVAASLRQAARMLRHAPSRGLVVQTLVDLPRLETMRQADLESDASARLSTDPIGAFLEERTEPAAGNRVQLDALVDEYNAWALGKGLTPLNRQAGKKFDRLPRGRASAGAYVGGIALRPDG